LEKVRVQIGPHRSKGVLIVTFYEKRESKAFFGFMSNEEKVCFERWRIPVVVDERPLPRKSSVGREVGDATDRLHHEIDLEKQRLCDMARLQTQQRILSILEVRTFVGRKHKKINSNH
jgi:Autophagy-related protein 101